MFQFEGGWWIQSQDIWWCWCGFWTGSASTFCKPHLCHLAATWPGLAIMSATVTPSISFNSQLITKVVKKSTEYWFVSVALTCSLFCTDITLTIICSRTHHSSGSFAEHINRDAATRAKDATSKSILAATTARKKQKIGKHAIDANRTIGVHVDTHIFDEKKSSDKLEGAKIKVTHSFHKKC